MKGLNHSSPESSKKLVKPDLPGSLLSHTSIPIYLMTQFLFMAETLFPLHPVRSLNIDLTRVWCWQFTSSMWGEEVGGARAGRTTCQQEEPKTWAAAFSGVSQAQCCGWEARRRPWCEGHNGWHYQSEEGQQAIQLKGSREQCHVSQITPKSLWFQLKRHVV